MPSNQPTKNPGIAAVLAFLFPGVGQIYNGQISSGLGIAIVVACLTACGFFLWPLLIFPLIIWIISIFTAYGDAEKYNEKITQSPPTAIVTDPDDWQNQNVEMDPQRAEWAARAGRNMR